MEIRERGSVRLLFHERTQKTSLPPAVATSEKRPRDHFQDEMITTKSPSAGFSCVDLAHCVTMAMRTEANWSSTVVQHHLERSREQQQEIWRENHLSSRIQTFVTQPLQSQT